MAQTTVDVVHDLDDQLTSDESRRDRLRSTIPVALAVSLLFGVVIAGSLALRNLLDFGVWLLAG